MSDETTTPAVPASPKIGDTRPAPQIGDTRPSAPREGGSNAPSSNAQSSSGANRRRRGGRGRGGQGGQGGQRQGGQNQGGSGAANQSSSNQRQNTRANEAPVEASAPEFDGDEAGRARKGRRRGGERRTRAQGRYLMCVHTTKEATHIATLEGRTMVEYTVAKAADETNQIDGNIYVGRIQNVLPGMELAFVDIGIPKNAVLYRGDVSLADDDIEGRAPSDKRIEQMIRSGQTIVCQVTKNAIGAKGARLRRSRCRADSPCWCPTPAPSASPSVCPTASAAACARSSTT